MSPVARTRVYLCLAFAFAFAFVAIPAPGWAASTGQIVGTVIDANTKAAVAKAKISAISPSGFYSAVSDAKGNFTIVGVVLDTYTIGIEAPGYEPFVVEGATVTADESYHLAVRLNGALHTIGHVRAGRITSAFQPQQTVDRYTVNSAGIDQLLGKSFDVSGEKLLSELPSVTVDRSGTPLIRGGTSFETSTQLEGIDYTTPARSLTNQFQNIGNQSLLNGIGSVEIIPGGGDASHGDTGTGIVSYTVKRGTMPAFDSFDYEVGLLGDAHQFAFEDGRTFGASGRLSNYASFISLDQAYQYGPYGTTPASIGASAITPDPNANSNVNAHTGSLYTTAFFNTASQQTRDFVDNFIYKFGAGGTQSLQFFYQTQISRQPQDYGGFQLLTYPFVGQGSSDIAAALGPYANSTLYPGVENALVSKIFAQYPGGIPGQPLTGPDIAYNPFTAFKLEYDSVIGASTALSARFYRTFSDQNEFQASQGLYAPLNGGTRTGVSSELTRQFGTKNSVQIGAKYEFAVPYGTISDYIDYLAAYGPEPTTAPQIQTLNPISVVPDFIVPSAMTPGCSPTPFQAGLLPCGYLARFFPNGNIPQLPPETEVPTAKQQSYALFAQDTWSPSDPLKVLMGLRLDGYNFLIPTDPENPPQLGGLLHQRLYEPHLGLSYRLDVNDSLRANFGRTLSIPLPTELGVNIDRSVYNAFNNVPSYDNSKGPYDPSRPQATQADYCGPGTPTIVSGTLVDIGNQPCANYADQLYWLMRNYRFGLQSQITYPLQGATFTNYDFSYSHQFKDGTALKFTPFYRRGYNVVEQTRTLEGWDPENGVADLSPDLYANLGVQSATGLELDVTKFRDFGLSYQFTATYINQIGNDPPGTYLPTASLQLGELYHSPNLAPLQSSLGLTYKMHDGLRFNPVFTVRSGYPYGAGIYYAVDYNGQPVYVPLTDALIDAISGPVSYLAEIGNAFVNPQNPGTIQHPNIAATRGTEGLVGAGALRSGISTETDLTIELASAKTRLVYGFAITNLFDQTADIPSVNLARVLIPVATGDYVSTGALTSPNPTHSTPQTVGSSTGPYIVFPNQVPLTLRFYVQAKL